MRVITGLRRSCLGIGVAGLFLASSTALAGYQLDPVRIEVNIPEGKKVGMASLKLTSTETAPIRLRVTLNDWTVDESGGLHLSETALPGSLMDRIRLNPKEFEVPPGGRQIIRLAVSLPDDAKRGEYRSMVMLEDLKTATQHLALAQGKSASIDVKKRIGLALYVYYGNPVPDPQVWQFIVQPELPGETGNKVSPQTESNQNQSNIKKISEDKAEPQPVTEQGLKAGVAATPKTGWKIHLDLENKGDRHSQLSASILILRANPSLGSTVDNLHEKKGSASKASQTKDTVVAEFTPKSLGNIFILPHQHFLSDFALASLDDVKKFGPGHYKLKLTLVQHNPDSAPPIKAETEIDVK